MEINRVIIVITFLFFSKVQSQIIDRFGILPNINIDYGISEKWSINSKIESRQIFKESFLNIRKNEGYKYLFTDVSLIMSKKINYGSSVGLGNLFRINKNVFIYRLIQQLRLDKHYSSFNLSHRFRTDQTIETNGPIEFRLRYRLSIEFPLSGKNLSFRDFYLKINNEILMKIKNNFDLETRLVPLIGYAFDKKESVELGLDYRLDSFIENQPIDHTLFLTLNYYCKL